MPVVAACGESLEQPGGLVSTAAPSSEVASSRAEIHSGRRMLILSTVPIHELLHTLTENADCCDYGAQ
jgi:hypothetical protein